MDSLIITVSCPKYLTHLRLTIKSFQARCVGPMPELLILTRKSHVEEMEGGLDGMFASKLIKPYPDEAEAIESNYAAHQAAKLLAWQRLGASHLIFVDDDVMAMQSWQPEMFFRQSGSPIIYHQLTTDFWTVGISGLFRYHVPRAYQLALPFAYTRDLLERLCHTPYYERSMDMRRQGNLIAAEFAMMGEFAHICAEGTARNIDKTQDHWTLNRNIFRDYARRRGDMIKEYENGLDSSHA